MRSRVACVCVCVCWAKPTLSAPKCLLALTWCLMDWIIKICRIKTFWLLNHLFTSQTGSTVMYGTTVHSHNRLAPSPHAGYQLGHTLLWDGITLFNQYLLHVSLHVMNSTTMLILQTSSRAEVRTAGTSFHLLHQCFTNLVLQAHCFPASGTLDLNCWSTCFCWELLIIWIVLGNTALHS